MLQDCLFARYHLSAQAFIPQLAQREHAGPLAAQKRANVPLADDDAISCFFNDDRKAVRGLCVITAKGTNRSRHAQPVPAAQGDEDPPEVFLQQVGLLEKLAALFAVVCSPLALNFDHQSFCF